MSEPRWLNDEEQATWRAYLRATHLLTVQLERELQAESELSHADYEILVQLSEAPRPPPAHERARLVHPVVAQPALPRRRPPRAPGLGHPGQLPHRQAGRLRRAHRHRLRHPRRRRPRPRRRGAHPPVRSAQPRPGAPAAGGVRGHRRSPRAGRRADPPSPAAGSPSPSTPSIRVMWLPWPPALALALVLVAFVAVSRRSTDRRVGVARAFAGEIALILALYALRGATPGASR